MLFVATMSYSENNFVILLPYIATFNRSDGQSLETSLPREAAARKNGNVCSDYANNFVLYVRDRYSSESLKHVRDMSESQR